MATIKHIFKGESLSMLFAFPAEYDMARIQSHGIWIGRMEFTGVIIGQGIELKLTSLQTDLMSGNQRVSLWIDDAVLGVRKPYIGDIAVENTNALPDNESTSEVYDVIVNVDISVTSIEAGDLVFNYVQGKSAYQVWLDAGNTGTVEDYLADIKGDPFTYDDFTPEQLESLKVKGDPFEFSDFTPEQIALLQKPASDIATTVSNAEGLRVTAETNRNNAEGLRLSAETTRGENEADRIEAEGLRAGAETGRQTAEGLRQQAENKRQTDTSTAISNAEQATDDANDAALLANEKAELANEKALLANEKAGLAETATTQANDARDGANSAAQSATNLVNSYATDLAAKELKANKQNNLTADGTGTKFPTVDAVNAGLAGKIDFRKMALLRGTGYLTYNSTTGFYEMNGLTDITEEQMMQIYNYTSQSVLLFGDEQFANAQIRTTYRRAYNGALGAGSFRYTFIGSAIEVYYCPMLISVAVGMFHSCSNLNTVKTLTLSGTQAANYTGMFMNCTALVNCEIKSINTNLSFQWSPLLTLESLQYLITNRNNGTKAITITVHPTVFAKLTDNTNYPTWYAVNQDALTKYITFASA